MSAAFAELKPTYIAPAPAAVAGNTNVTFSPTVNVQRASALAERM